MDAIRIDYINDDLRAIWTRVDSNGNTIVEIWYCNDDETLTLDPIFSAIFLSNLRRD